LCSGGGEKSHRRKRKSEAFKKKRTARSQALKNILKDLAVEKNHMNLREGVLECGEESWTTLQGKPQFRLEKEEEGENRLFEEDRDRH